MRNLKIAVWTMELLAKTFAVGIPCILAAIGYSQFLTESNFRNKVNLYD
jgi:hypothetical protein